MDAKYSRARHDDTTCTTGSRFLRIYSFPSKKKRSIRTIDSSSYPIYALQNNFHWLQFCKELRKKCRERERGREIRNIGVQWKYQPRGVVRRGLGGTEANTTAPVSIRWHVATINFIEAKIMSTRFDTDTPLLQSWHPSIPLHCNCNAPHNYKTIKANNSNVTIQGMLSVRRFCQWRVYIWCVHASSNQSIPSVSCRPRRWVCMKRILIHVL